jgi:hypothetical protein
MRFSAVDLLTVLLVSGGVVTATNCIRGRYYCGATLNDLGNYMLSSTN